MNKKITCPVCCEANEETSKTCKNQKCKWDLTFAKDGAFIGLSEGEIKQYNTSLLEAKMTYSSKSFKINLPKNLSKIDIRKFEKSQFENTEEYTKRISEIDYVIIGHVELIKYNREKECFSIECYIDKSIQDKVSYAHSYITEVFIPVDEAKKLYDQSTIQNLIGRIKIINQKLELVDIFVHQYSFKNIIKRIKEIDDEIERLKKQLKNKR